MAQSPVKLPDDYIDFLKSISGDKNPGIAFQVDGEGREIFIWSAEFGYERITTEFNLPLDEDFMKCTWLIGDDVGDLLYFYGVGDEGYGIHKTEAGVMDISDSSKISDSLTDLLVNGVGLDILFTL